MTTRLQRSRRLLVSGLCLLLALLALAPLSTRAAHYTAGAPLDNTLPSDSRFSKPTHNPLPATKAAAKPPRTPRPTHTPISPTPTPTAVLPPQSAISGKVWLDTNFTGTIDGSETGLAQIEVRLYKELPGNELVVLDSRITDANGNYTFPALANGIYAVGTVEGFSFIPSTDNPRLSIVLVGAPIEDVNIGLFPLSSQAQE